MASAVAVVLALAAMTSNTSPTTSQGNAALRAPDPLPATLAGRSVVLIGLMGAGKTSIGRRLAARLGLPFRDADAEIEMAAGCSIPELFERFGEKEFRDGERRVIRRLLAGDPLVLATGGGAFMDPDTRAAVRRDAVSVWMRAKLPTLLRRVSGRTNRPLGMNVDQYGVLAGLTVYAVPQVLAATAPMGPVAVQIGTLVKLVRVLMLGPVVLILSLIMRQQQAASGRVPLNIRRLVPWFILGFLALAGLRSFDLIPAVLLPPIAWATSALTILSMAALGLGTDLRVIARAGGRVSLAVIASLLLMLVLALGLIRLIGVS